MLALCALTSLSACLWRPPPIPPLANPNEVDAGRGSPIDASAQMPPDVGSATTFEDCRRAAASNDGSIPERVIVDGSVISCGQIDASASGDGAAASDGSGDSTGDGGLSATDAQTGADGD